MNHWQQDFVLSLRRLRRSPGFAVAAIVTLALGIGANTAVFTAVNSILFRPLGVEHEEQLVALNHHGRTEVPTHSYPNYRDIRDRNTVFSGTIAYTFVRANLIQGAGRNQIAFGYAVSGNYFDVLGAKIAAGRSIEPADDTGRGGHPIVVLAHAFWKKHFGADPLVVGKPVKIDGLDYTVVGVADPRFFGTELIFNPDFWVPMVQETHLDGGDWLDARNKKNTFVIGRLKPGATMAQAESSLNVIASQLGREYPDADAGMQITLSHPGLAGSYLRGAISGFSGVLMALGGIVLLVACVNLSGLLLARATDRRKEIAIRLALGVPRYALVRQLLTESLVLATVGGAAGVLLASWIIDGLSAWHPFPELPVFPALTIDTRVLLFAAAAAIGTGILFGLAPALQSVRTDLISGLKNEASGVLRRWHSRDILVAVQVALSVVLVVGSVLVLRSLRNALNMNLGFDPRHVATAGFDLSMNGYDDAKSLDFQHRLLAKVRVMPGIESAGIITKLPLSLRVSDSLIYAEGAPAIEAAQLPTADTYRISPGYLQTARTHLLYGRDFSDADRRGTARVAIVNRAFAAQILHTDNAIGKRFHFSGSGWREIVGVVEDGKYRSLNESPRPAVFESADQDIDGETTIVARSELPEPAVAAMLSNTVQEMDSDIALYTVGSWSNQLSLALLPARLSASVLGAFGLLALVLAATGVHAMMAYTVAGRSREIGIRMTLGARSGDVIRAVMGRGATLLGAGVACGIGLSLAVGRMLAVIMYGVSAYDVPAYATALAVMSMMALVACWVPARRAVGMDPARVLRNE